MSTYIFVDDITDNVIKSFPADVIQQKLELSDDEMVDLAERKGIRDADSIDNNPLHRKIKDYLIAWIGQEICFDYLGTNNTETAEFEKYMVKYNLYRDKVKSLDAQITYEMILGSVDEIRDRATVGSGVLFRS